MSTMRTPSRILLPVDYSDRCLNMLRYLRLFVQRYQAELVLLHVVNPVFVAPETGISGPVMLPVPEWLIEQESKKLDDFAREETAGMPVRRLIYEGLAESQIVETAKAEQVDLIAMSTHGLGVFRRLLLGSVTAKVLDDVNCPVLTSAHVEKMQNAYSPAISSIVCGIDLEITHPEPLQWAARLANDFGAKLSVVHAAGYVDKNIRPTYEDQLKPQLTELVRQHLRNLGGEIALAPESVEIFIQDGDPAHGVCGQARNIAADLIVIGRSHKPSHGGRLNRDAYGIISHSPCPVLSV
ncbi:MAG: universal stress protein [Alphaproteobacteria bacterium]|nr:universal stress protein [Alphaproteobacteria bacterium]